MTANRASIQLKATYGRPGLLLSNEPQIAYVLLEAGLPASIEQQARLPLNLCLVLDRSSSMRGERLHQLKAALASLLDQLAPEDRISVVVFNDRAEVIVPSQQPTDKYDILRRLYSIEASGGTEMAGGIDLGLQELRRGRCGARLNQLVLLTDGRTYGDEHRCIELARDARSAGIGITAFGIGNEWNEDLLEIMAAGANCRTAFITTSRQIVQLFAAEVQRLHSITAQNVELRLLGRPGVEVPSVYRVEPFLAPLELQSPSPSRWSTTLGDWAGSDRQEFLLELAVPPLPAGIQPFLRLELQANLPARYNEQQRFVLDCELPVLPAPQIAEEVNQRVEQCVSRAVAHRLQAAAWRQIAAGQVDDATRKLAMAGTRLLNAGENALARMLHDEALRLKRGETASEEGRKRIRYGTRGLLGAQLALRA